MNTFTIKDLRRILEDSAGAADGVDWESPVTLDLPFADLGYDSLALLELAAKVQQEYRTRIPDEAVSEMVTPRAAVEYVNQRFAEV
jgi:act minimal PKS acyl carrier protein